MNNSALSTLSLDLQALWSQVCEELQVVISVDAVNRWFRPLKLIQLSDKILTLQSDNSIYQYWIEENYLPQLTGIASRVLNDPVTVVFKSAETASAQDNASLSSDKTTSEAVPVKVKKDLLSKALAPSSADARSSLNPRSTFDSFVVGVNNQFAHAAALAVAQAPARTYNPLFLHGSVGLGKTHLMQAVGNFIQQNKKHLRVFYVTSEQFTNDYITAIQHGELAKFRRSYRQVDVLLIDDIQFLAGKDRSQEEFFHTFNTLFDGSKQIVLTSDSPPTEIANLEKRLTSRFEWGLTAELQPPDAETRLAILRHKMERMPEQLDAVVLDFIAERVRTNVRRLEGALNRVAAFASLHGRSITVAQAEVLLKDLLQQEELTTVSIDSIQRTVAEQYDIRLADMSSKRRPANIALPRMVAMYLSRRLTSSSLNDIGDAFGGRDHGTVLHASKTIEEKMKADEKLRRTVTHLAEKLGTSSGQPYQLK